MAANQDGRKRLGRRKLTPDDVRRIRTSKESDVELAACLAACLDVTPSCICAVRNGRTWQWVGGVRAPDPLATKNRGERNSHAKLTDQAVREMRDLYRQGFRSEVIARRFGVSRPVAQAAITGRSWAHIPGAITGRRHRPPKAFLAEEGVR